MKLNPKKVQDGYIIAADAGLKYLLSCGIAPDLIIGDFDSMGFVPDDINTIVLPKEKDDTDMLAAIKIGIEDVYKRQAYNCSCVLYSRRSNRINDVRLY